MRHTHSKNRQSHEVTDYRKSVKPCTCKSAQKVLMLLYENSHLTRDELSERTGLSLGGIKKIINSLREKGYIQRIGSNKSGYWKVNIE